MDHSTTSQAVEIAFLALQTINVAFLLLHDWVPLGRLNNLPAIHSPDSLSHRIFVTLLGGVPTAIGLFYSALYFNQHYPHWLVLYLWITYILFAVGLLRAWWIPYLILPDARRAERYRVLFSGTHTFLPIRNGLAPDTLHTLFHLNLIATLVFLLLRTHLPAVSP
jgi:hypothetical protein